MAANLHELEAQARELSNRERARLALVLIESLDGQDEGDVAETWRIEVARRWAEIESGTEVITPRQRYFRKFVAP